MRLFVVRHAEAAPGEPDAQRPLTAAGLTAEPDDRLAPGATADSLRAAVDGRGDTVVTVGHQPDCSEIVLALTGYQPAFPPGGVAEVEL